MIKKAGEDVTFLLNKILKYKIKFTSISETTKVIQLIDMCLAHSQSQEAVFYYCDLLLQAMIKAPRQVSIIIPKVKAQGGTKLIQSVQSLVFSYTSIQDIDAGYSIEDAPLDQKDTREFLASLQRYDELRKLVPAFLVNQVCPSKMNSVLIATIATNKTSFNLYELFAIQRAFKRASDD